MHEVWAELSATMRLLRLNAGLSLRRVEAETGIGRGTLSQYETGRARPNRAVVEWYDTAFAANGLLHSVFAEARGAYGSRPPLREPAIEIRPGDRADVGAPSLAYGLLVERGAMASVSWPVRNTGAVEWAGRRLHRVGAPTGQRLIASAPSVPVPVTAAGETVTVEVGFTVPPLPGTFAAYWQMTDTAGNVSLPDDCLFALIVNAR